MSDIAISCEGLGKKYRIGQRESYKALRDVLTDAFRAPVRRLFSSSHHRNGQSAAGGETFWALKDVSFDVKHGEVIGIIGSNGAGKSTLLKILSRITKPTEGSVRLNGRVGSLLEVGTGFHPELSGRENIFLNGTILGMKKREIARKFDEIVAFAGIEKFLDTPVKRYSSGMYVRLAFAVAAHLEPEILVIDEVLAVGDAQFQKKCLGKMGDVARQGRTVLFVSHNMAAVQALCTKSALLSHGRCIATGDTKAIVNTYMRQQPTSTSISALLQQAHRVGSGKLKVVDVAVSNYTHTDAAPASGSHLKVELTIINNTHEPINSVDIGYSFHDEYEANLGIIYSSYTGKLFAFSPGVSKVNFVVKSPLLTGGQYYLGLRLVRLAEDIDWPRILLPFDVVDDDYYRSGNTDWRNWGPVLIDGEWLPQNS